MPPSIRVVNVLNNVRNILTEHGMGSAAGARMPSNRPTFVDLVQVDVDDDVCSTTSPIYEVMPR